MNQKVLSWAIGLPDKTPCFCSVVSYIHLRFEAPVPSLKMCSRHGREAGLRTRKGGAVVCIETARSQKIQGALWFWGPLGKGNSFSVTEFALIKPNAVESPR